jgi:hypothetical protein
MSKELKRRSILGSGLFRRGSPDYSPEATAAELKDKGLAATETIEVENPVTGKRAMVVITRDGTREDKVIMALADKNMSQDAKDHVLGMYLFERGKDNASFLMDIYRYKGEHTKETRAFKSQVRFDFEVFVEMFASYLKSTAIGMAESLGLGNLEEFASGYLSFIAEADNKGKQVEDYCVFKGIQLTKEKAAMIYLCMTNYLEAGKFKQNVRKMAESRERDKGKGIYIDKEGRTYSIDDESVNMEDVIKRDKERMADLQDN